MRAKGRNMEHLFTGEPVAIDTMMAANTEERTDAVFPTDDEVVNDNDFIGMNILVIREETS
tara:strand:+ start:519 stop:701 length:183 start_codon:yes stop_codon:yes gene_type:complete